MSTKSRAVAEAFVNVMRRCILKDCGVWIPISYWVGKVCHQLDADRDEQDIILLENNNNKLLTMLQKNHIVGRQFEKEESHGSIIRVSWNKRKVAVDITTKKDVIFLCLETNKMKQPQPRKDQ